MTTVSDDFNRADNTSLGPNWSAYAGEYDLQIVSQAVTYKSGGYYGARWNANTFSGNQFAQLTLVTLPSNDWMPGPCIRAANTDANFEGYWFSVNASGAFRLYRNTSLVHSSASGQFTNGDVGRIEDRGSGAIVVMKNGVDLYTGYTDGSPLTGTYIGLQGDSAWNGATLFVVDTWSGGDLTAGASGVVISDAGDEYYQNGETGITITGTGFEAAQGAGFVKISPTDDIADAAAVTQTVTSWADTSITFTAVKGSLSLSTNLYLFVENNSAESNASGHVVQFWDAGSPIVSYVRPIVFVKDTIIQY